MEPNFTDLVSVLTTTAPAIDGAIDPMWEQATKLTGETEVPNPGNGLFAGYIGDKYKFTLRSLYDNQNIYLLVEWSDPSKSLNPAPWYFDKITSRWKQEGNSKQFDVNGILLREGMNEDKLCFLWNIDNSTPKFISQTCYASCHIFNTYRNYLGVAVPNKGGNHYTNGSNEKLDQWWMKISRDGIFDQMSDEYQDWAGGPAVTDTVGGSGNGRHVDDLMPPSPFSTAYIATKPASGTINNTQSLKLDGTGLAVNVPKWVIPEASNYNYILATDTVAGGKAKKIIAVSSTGVLSHEGGSTIDPNVGVDYLQVAGIHGGVGIKSVPSFISSPITGGRGDIKAKAVYTGTGWIVEIKRLLNTNSTLKQDVDFTSLQDQPFGVAIWNNANNQHSIKPNLVMKFKK